MNHSSNHFDEVTGLLYLEGQLDAGRADEVAGHVAACSECRGLLGALEKEGVWLRQALRAEDEAVPARLIPAPGRSSGRWGWMVAFGLGAAGAYTLWSGLIDPWFTQAAQAGFTQETLLTMLFFSGAFWKGWDSMQSLMQFLAAGTLATVMIWLLRKQWQRFAAVAFVMGALVCALALPPSAAAADVERGKPSYTLPAGQEVKTDLIVWAVRTRIDGDVDGDLIVWSQNVTVNGHVKGDILGWAQELRVNGAVDGNVRAWAQTLSLSGTVGKNVLALTGESYVDQKATVGGTMTMLAGSSEVNGRLAGDLLALSGDLGINGSLGRDAMIRGGQLTIGPSAEIKGQTKYTGNRQPEVSSSAKLGSPIEVTLRKPGPDYSRARYYWRQVLLWGASFVFGLVLLLAAPGFCSDAVQASKRIGPSLGFGALFMFATPIAVLISCLTIVGLGVGIAALMCYLIAVYSAQVFIGSWLGETLLGTASGIGPLIGRMALGLAILHALRMVPFVGPLIGLLVVLWGMGALVLALYRNMRSPQPAAA
jgi:cytoskeletal protein CcmA (bactofilin family)